MRWEENQHFLFLFILFFELEKSKPRSTSRSEAQHSSKKNSRRKDEETDAERRILEKTRRGRTLEDGNEVNAFIPVRRSCSEIHLKLVGASGVGAFECYGSSILTCFELNS